jgi:hypothetical protein
MNRGLFRGFFPGSLKGGPFFRSDTFTGIAGSLTYTLSKPPLFTSGTLVLSVYINGVKKVYGTDYTLSGLALTLTGLASSTIVIEYWSEYLQGATVFPTDATALSIYNKIAVAAGGVGAYWDMHEGSGGSGVTRADTANATCNAAVSGGTMGTATGPRGGADVAAGFNGSSYMTAANHSNIQVAAYAGGHPGKHCLFGWANVTTNGTTQVLAGKYDGISAGGMEYQLDYVGSARALNGSTGYRVASISYPTAGVWHFHCLYVDQTDDKLRYAVDNGTPAVSATASDTTTTTNPLQFGLISGFSYFTGALSRWGFIKNNYLTSAEQAWLINSGNGRDWAEIKALAGF